MRAFMHSIAQVSTGTIIKNLFVIIDRAYKTLQPGCLAQMVPQSVRKAE